MRLVIVAILITVSAAAHASITVTSVDIQANTSVTNGYTIIDGNHNVVSTVENDTVPGTISITTPTSTTQSIGLDWNNWTRSGNVVIPPGDSLLTGSDSSAYANASLDLTNGIQWSGSASSNIAAYSEPYFSPQSSASITVAIDFQVFDAPVSLSFSEPLGYYEFSFGEYSNDLDGYSLTDLSTNQQMLTNSPDPSQSVNIVDYILQPGTYAFSEYIGQSNYYFNPGGSGYSGGPVQLSIVPEVPTGSLTALAMTVLIWFGWKRSTRRHSN